MYLIESKRDGEWILDPGIAMALQEYVKDNIFLDGDILFPYIMQPTVQIGKFQNAYEEVNQPYLDEHNIKVVRRETGGGAIYLDDRNMNFSFLLTGDQSVYGNYKRLYEPAIEALRNLGVEGLEQQGRNDLVLDGKKVSGAAMTFHNERIYAGFSLLLDPDFERMVLALNPNQKKISSHGIQSIRSRVGSIRPYLSPEYQDISIEDFTDYMICQLLKVSSIDDAKRYVLTAEDWKHIDKMAAEKYNNWDWNYGRFKEFEYQITERFPVGTISVGIQVEHGKVADIQIGGDFFATKDIRDVEEVLIGTRLKKDDLLEALTPIDLTNYFGNLTKEAFVQFLLSEKDAALV